MYKLKLTCILAFTKPAHLEMDSRNNVNVAVPGRNRISLVLLRSKRSSVELPLRAGLIRAG